MLIALWIVNALLALAFLGAGLMKIVRPVAALQASGMAWTEDFGGGTVKLIGALEVVGAVGLILPILTPLAAVGLAIVMIGATVVHTRRKESATPSIVLAVLSIVSAALGFLVVLG